MHKKITSSIDSISAFAKSAISVASCVVTIVVALGLPQITDMNQSLPLILLCIAALLVGFASGWCARVDRHAKNQVDTSVAERLREELANEKLLNAKLISELSTAWNVSENQMKANIESLVDASISAREKVEAIKRSGLRNKEDADKFDISIRQLETLSPQARRVLSDVSDFEAASFREYCSKCILIETENEEFPTWPCNCATGIPAKFFPAIAIEGKRIDALISRGLISGSRRVEITPVNEMRIKLLEDTYEVVPKSMLIMKTTGEQIVSAFLYPLTEVGLELSSLCEIGTAESLTESTIAYLTSNNMTLVKVSQSG